MYRDRKICKAGDANQIEAIAQGRLLASLNFPTPGVPGQVVPGVQWELSVPKSFVTIPEPDGEFKGKRLDILKYVPNDPGFALQLAEVKMDYAASADLDAGDQLGKYIEVMQALYPGGAVGVLPLTGYEDFFRVQITDCDESDRRIVDHYTVKESLREPGVAMVSRYDTTVDDCNNENELEEIAEHEEVPENTETDRSEPCVVNALGTCTTPGFTVDDDNDQCADLFELAIRFNPTINCVDLPTVNEIREVVTAPLTQEWTPEALKFWIAVTLTAGLTEGMILAQMGAVTVAVGASGVIVIGLLIGVVFVVGAIFIGVYVWSVWGDPHLATLDGLKYSLQEAGEFHLLEIPEQGIDVQARFVPLNDRVSEMRRVVTEVADQTVEFGNGWVKIDGEPTTVPNDGALQLGEGAYLSRHDDAFALTWPGYGERLAMAVRGRVVGFLVPQEWETKGLLGNSNGDPTDDLKLRDGTQLAANTPESTLRGAFADSWRITDEESFFSYAAGETTATLNVAGFPASDVNVSNFLPSDQTAAAQGCAQAGVPAGPQFDACMLDLLVTRNADFAVGSGLVDEQLYDPAARAFDAGGSLSENFEGSVTTNFASIGYQTDPATSRVAAPILDTPGYRFYARAIPRHDKIAVGMDLIAYGPITTDGQPNTVVVKADGVVVATIQLDGASPSITGPLSGTITQTSSGTANGVAFKKFRLQGTLGHTAEAVDVELVPSNFRTALGTSLGVDNIQLQLSSPTAQTFAVSLPLTTPGATGSQTDPANGAGHLEPGGQDNYDFTIASAQAGRALVVDAGECSLPVTIRVTNRTTGAVVAEFIQTCNDQETPALPAGNYRLAVTAPAATSGQQYSFGAFLTPDAQTFTYDIGSVVSDGVPASGSGNLETIASKDRYTFNAPTGGLDLAYNNISGSKTFEVVNTSTSQVVATGSGDTHFSLPAGSYRLDVVPQAAGTYAFELLTTPNDDDGDTSITTGIDYVDINFGESTNTTSWQTPNTSIKPDSNQPWTGAAIPGTQAGTPQLAAAGTAVTNGAAYFDVAPGTVDYTNPGTAPFEATMRFALSDRADSNTGEVIFRKGVTSTTGGLVTLKMHDNSEGYPECRFSDQANDTSDPTVRANEDLSGSPLSLFSPANDPDFFAVTCWSTADSLGISVRDATGVLVAANSVPRPSGWLGPNPTAGFRIGGASTTVSSSTCTTCLFDRFTWTVDRTFTLTNVPWANDTGAWAQTANYPFTSINTSGKFADTWGTNPMTINGITTVTETVDKVSRTGAKFVAPSVGLLGFANGLVPQDDPFRVAAIVKLTSAGLSDTNGSTIWYHREGVAMKLVPNGTDKQSLSCVWPVTTGANPTYREIVSTQTIGNSTKYFSLECWRYKEVGDPQFVYGYTFDAGADGVGAVSVIADPNTLVDVDAPYTLSVGNAAAADGSIPSGGGAQQFRGNMDRLSIYGNWS